MKRLIFFSFFVPCISLAQSRPDIDSLAFNFSEVVKTDSLTAKELFSNAKLFIARAFKSAKAVTQLEDPESNTLVVKGILVVPLKKLPYGFSYMESFTTPLILEIQAKDGRYKYTMNEFYVKDNAVYEGYNLSSPYTKQKGEIGQRQHKELWTKMKQSAFDIVTAFIAGMKKQMAAKNDF